MGCDAGSEWAYVGFNEAPNLTDTDAQSGGYSTFSARIKWDDRLETVAMIQRWGERFLHFRNDDSALLAMMASREALLELEWYGAGAAYFRFDLAGAEPVIRGALTRCRASAMQDSYAIKTIQQQLLRAG